MVNVESVIDRVGGQDAAARLCGVGVEAVRKWRQARAIPTRHWPVLVQATGLDFASLAGPGRVEVADPAPARQAEDAPPGATAALVLADGTVFWGHGLGAATRTVGEVCFTTGLTGYQETLTDPSFAGQLLTFTFPHIGNVGTNLDDLEAQTPVARGVILKAVPTEASNWRSSRRFDAWLSANGVPGIAGLDTRTLTRRIRDLGAPNGVLVHAPDGRFELGALKAEAAAWPGLEGMDLAAEVTCRQSYAWNGGVWDWAGGFDQAGAARHHVVAVDYGAKRNILRCLASAGCRVTVVPATATSEDILRHEPDGVFLSNGPGDPAATGAHAVPAIQGVLEAGVPLFGICLGHQLLGLALGGRTRKLPLGHRGANHPVKDLDSGRVLITSQNHGFAVIPESLPKGVCVTHVSLFDGTNEGLACEAKRCFSVQFHPEASPGPHDAKPLFERFVRLMESTPRLRTHAATAV